jgi:hypothetical protein
MTLAPNAASAQFPPPPPMASPPPIAAGGPPPLPAGGPSAFAGGPPMGLGGEPRAGFGGPAPRPGAGPGPRGSLGALSVRAGGRGGPAIARSDQARSASVSYRRSGSISHGYGGRRYGYGSAYAAGAYAGYGDGGSNDGYYSDSDCYYAYGRYRRVLACN